MKTKKDLQNEIKNLEESVKILTKKKKEEKHKPIYVVYPDKFTCEDWYNKNETNIKKFHEDENNFKYWHEIENWNGDKFDKKERKQLPNKYSDDLYHWSWFYMHGKLDDECCYDICDMNLQFPFDEQLPTRIFSEPQFIEGLGILYKVNAKLANGKDVLIFAFCSLRCSFRDYVEAVSSSTYAYEDFSKNIGMIQPQGENREEVWKLREERNNYAGDLGFKAIYPRIPHHWKNWKEHLKEYKVSKICNGYGFGAKYRLDNVSTKRSISTNLKWEGRIIYADDKESLEHCMNPLEWS